VSITSTKFDNLSWKKVRTGSGKIISGLGGGGGGVGTDRIQLCNTDILASVISRQGWGWMAIRDGFNISINKEIVQP
jgi:hypothetical protein